MPKAAEPEQVSGNNWVKTRTQHVYRHSKSGRYYVRGYRQGREVWKALGTTNYQVAKATLARRSRKYRKPER